MRHLLVASLTLALSACETTPKRDNELPVKNLPACWEARSNTILVPPSWLAEFVNVVLQKIVRQSLITNFDLYAAATRVNSAKAAAKIAGSGRWPQLFFNPGYARGQTHAVGKPVERYSGFYALFDLNWVLDVWGLIKDSQHASVLDAQATSHDFQSARLLLADRTAQAYFILTEANLHVKVAEESIKNRHTVVN